MFCWVLPSVLLSMTVLAVSAQSELAEERLKIDEVVGAGQYFLYSEAKTWNEGMDYCALEGAQMAVANTPEQAEALKMLLPAYKVTSVHIGFHDQFVESQYTTIDGDSVNAENWAPGFPTNKAANNCGGFVAEGMKDITCATAQPTICQLRSWSSYSAIPPYGLYNLHVERRGWTAAWEICQREGGHLWTVDSLAEAETVSKMFEQTTDFWVGVHRITGDDAFINILGKPLNATGFMRWETGFPFGSASTRPYVALKGNGGAPTLWTNTFSSTLPFICEHAAS